MSFLSLGLPVAALSGDNALGQVEAKSGKVLYQSENGWSDLNSGDLAEGTLLRTGQDGEAVLVFPDSSRVRVSANSQVKIVKIADGRTSLKLERGRVLGKAEGALNIETHRTATNASAGEFVLETTATGTELNVLDGNAKLSSQKDLVNPSLENIPEDFDSEALTQLDGLADVQQEGEVAAVEAEAAAEQDEDEDDDDDGGGVTGEEDNSIWAYVGAGTIVAVVIFAVSGDDNDDEVAGSASPNLP